MSLPLNGFTPNNKAEYSPEQQERAGGQGGGQGEDWPDWSDTEEGERESRDRVQIHIQASERPAIASTGAPLSPQEEQEPWDDFEDPEPGSDLSPTTPTPDPVVLRPPTGGAVAPQKPAPEHTRTSSKPLKLSPRSPAERKPTSWDNGWDQEGEPGDPPPTERKPLARRRGNEGADSLGKEFTIEEIGRASCRERVSSPV